MPKETGASNLHEVYVCGGEASKYLSSIFTQENHWQLKLALAPYLRPLRHSGNQVLHSCQRIHHLLLLLRLLNVTRSVLTSRKSKPPYTSSVSIPSPKVT